MKLETDPERLRIEFLLRSDGHDKPGGDTSKAEKFADILSGFGHDVRLVYGKESIVGSSLRVDICHLVNLDLPIENYGLASSARRYASKIVLSTVHHPLAAIETYFKCGEDTYFAGMSRLGLGVERAISFREYLKLLRRGHLAAPKFAIARTTKLQQKLLAAVDIYLPMTPAEERAIQADTATQIESFLVPNGFTFADEISTEQSLADDSARRWEVCVVGRIEPRKNTLAMAKAARELGTSAVFVGSLNANHRRYCQEFLEVIASTTKLYYLGPRPSLYVKRIMQNSSCYVNASWFEVVSQADVEAASLGLKMVVSPHSYLLDVLRGSSPVTLDPADLQDLNDAPRALRAALDAASDVKIEQPVTWLEASRRLEDAYRRALGLIARNPERLANDRTSHRRW